MKRKPKILVIDDEEVNLELLESYLLPLDYDVIKAQTGGEGLEKVKATPPDVILLDVMMPDMDGLEVARRLKTDEQTRLIPIVMVTALTEVGNRIKALDAGANDFMSKPVDKAELQATVRSQVQIKAYHDLMRTYQEDLEIEVKRKTDQLRKAFEKMRQSEEKYRNLIEGSIQGVLVHREHKPLFLNQAWASLLGYTPEEILGMESVIPLISDNDQERVRALEKACLRGENLPPAFEYQGIRKDGTLIWLENRVMQVLWDEQAAIQLSPRPPASPIVSRPQNLMRKKERGEDVFPS